MPRWLWSLVSLRHGAGRGLDGPIPSLQVLQRPDRGAGHRVKNPGFLVIYHPIDGPTGVPLRDVRFMLAALHGCGFPEIYRGAPVPATGLGRRPVFEGRTPPALGWDFVPKTAELPNLAGKRRR